MTVARLVLLLCLAFLVCSCSSAAQTPVPVYLQAAGSTSWLPLITELAAAYHERYPYVFIETAGGDSALGEQMVAAGQVDLGLVSRPQEALPSTLRTTVVARDAIAVIVHPTNPITSATLMQVRGLFSGRLNDWQQLGGASLAVQVISREDGSGTRTTFERMAMQGMRVTPMALVMPSSRAVVERVGSDAQAVGYVSMGYLDARVKALEVEGLPPAPANASSGAYVLTRELALLTPASVSPEANAFLDFVLGPAGQAIVAQHYGRVR